MRDLLRFVLNLVLGPPLGFIVCIPVMMVLMVVAQPGELQSRIDGAFIFLVFALPFILISHLLGFLPGLLTAILGSILDRVFLSSRRSRLVAILIAAGLATYAGDWWLFGRSYAIPVGSQELFFSSVVAGGAVAGLLCALLVEWIAPMRVAVPAVS